MTAEVQLSVQGLWKRYGAVAAVQDVSLQLPLGQTLALLGPSGCGKSTLLRVIAGLERPDAGTVRPGGQDLTHAPPEQRGVGLVFQDYALFPHLSVLDNVAYGLRRRGLPGPQARARAHETLEQVGLGTLAGRRTTELSGGQQQRVALARALAPQPQLLLLDEPLSNLDEQLRSTLRSELRELFAQLNTAVLLVTHDQREAQALADTVALMRAGALVQTGPVAEVFERPATAWAARFLGQPNLYPLPDGRVRLVPESAVQLGQGPAWPVVGRQPLEHGLRVTLAHDLGPLVLHLSPREAAGLGDTLRAAVQPDGCLTLPEEPAA
ncbi:ABC transporter ATP-binding protein [Deinococcus sonorensis]|uniref:ABC transporter ATP-binding protein n=2 Tax=Deinococcus sonorensis TaxID=309891 RepID=A0AAU7U9F5_9DEIO